MGYTENSKMSSDSILQKTEDEVEPEESDVPQKKMRTNFSKPSKVDMDRDDTVVAKKAKAIFDEIFEELTDEHSGSELIFPNKMVWLNGAPGAGKGTNTATIMRILEIPSKPIEVSSLLTSPEAEALKASGKLVDDKTVVKLVFETLLRPENANGVIIDGFPRTKVQAECLKLLVHRLQSDAKNKWCKFTIVNFMVSRETSINRQLARGRAALEHNKIVKESAIGEEVPVRSTDLSWDVANFRYQTYLNETRESLSILQDLVEYDEINAEGSLEEVRERIYKVFSVTQ